MSQNKECVFCKIVNGEIPAKIVNENEHAVAFLDVSPISSGHILVIPKKHYLDLSTCNVDYLIDVIKLLQETTKLVESCKKLDPWGFNYLSNQGSIAGQEVNHFHFHVIPKYSKNEGFDFSSTKKSKSQESLDDVYEMLLKKKKKKKIL